ncbi:UNVERIFIED_CONTAM: hypothetical protein RMT77_008415 [Armadillidium vulgare]
MDKLLPTYRENTPNCIKFSGWFCILLLLTAEIVYFIEHFYVGNLSELGHLSFLKYSSFHIANFIAVAINVFIVLHGAALSFCMAKLYKNLNKKLKEVLLPLTVMERDSLHLIKNELYINDDILIDEIERYRCIHLKMWYFTQDVGDYISSKLFVVVTTLFLMVCFNVYNGLTSLLLGNAEEKTYMNFSIVFLCLSLLLLPSYAADILTREHNRTTEILNWCQISSSNSERLVTDLVRFSLQISHCQPLLNIFGFFSLSRAFFIAMFGTICTYVVILLQFSTSETCENDVKNSSQVTLGK